MPDNEPEPSQEVSQICEEMEGFEASGSVANTGPGSRREGEEFEQLIARLWQSFIEQAIAAGADVHDVAGNGRRRYARLTAGPRSLFVPTPATDAKSRLDAELRQWLRVDFGVEELAKAYSSAEEAIDNYAPTQGPYAGSEYPKIYSGLETRFDDTLILVEHGVLREKILLEYKTAKSSNGRQIDGNAHERLSFQILQYLEVANWYAKCCQPHEPKCSLMVIANGAFVRYRNKYHVSFHIQARRLARFPGFSMNYACTKPEYVRFLMSKLSWLLEGKAVGQGRKP